VAKWPATASRAKPGQRLLPEWKLQAVLLDVSQRVRVPVVLPVP